MNNVVIEQIIADARPINAEYWQIQLVNSVMKAASIYARNNKMPLGLSFAAAFDLIVAAQYYGNVANKGWIYCGQKSPILLYPYTNTCPRCAIKNRFHFHKANKPRSGNIGSITSMYLCLCYKWFFENSGFPEIEVLSGKEPVDVLIIDRKYNKCLLAEIKASPLIIFPLATQSDRLTEESESGRKPTGQHEEITIPRIADYNFQIFLPVEESDSTLIEIGRKLKDRDNDWAAKSISIICNSSDFFIAFFKAWNDAFKKYSGQLDQNSSYWLTNSCGAPRPIPASWPHRSAGGGYETISDNKTSVGMDRTDDIKKGTYQVLKIGSLAKYQRHKKWHIAVGLVSNIHAVQHHAEYIKSIEDIMWIKTGNINVNQVGDLPPETYISNLFDGIISFTSSIIRDEWLKKIFYFDKSS